TSSFLPLLVVDRSPYGIPREYGRRAMRPAMSLLHSSSPAPPDRPAALDWLQYPLRWIDGAPEEPRWR
ncbi:hypothetical protein PENTCL1PPCAC_7650, partial [Pristionchus entomophagus]